MLLKRFFWLTMVLSMGVGCVTGASSIQDTTDALLCDLLIAEMDMDAPPDTTDPPHRFGDSDALDWDGIMPSGDSDLAAGMDSFDGSSTVDFTVSDVDTHDLEPGLSNMAPPVAD